MCYVQEDWLEESLFAFQAAVEGKELEMSVEYKVQGQVSMLIHAHFYTSAFESVGTRRRILVP